MKRLSDMDSLKGTDIPRTPYFTKQEFDSRLQKIRDKMSETGIDVLLVNRPENICYLTGYHTFGGAYQCLIVPAEGEMFHILRYLECFLTRVYSIIEPTHIIIWDDTDDPLDITAQQLKTMGLEKSVIGIEGSFISASTANGLFGSDHGAMPDAEWRYADKIVQNARRLKSEAELNYLRKSGQMSVQGVKAGLDAVEAGKTDNHVAAAATAKLILEGSDHMLRSPIVNSGWRSGIPHTTFERTTIAKGETVLIELSGWYHRYVAPISRTAVVGSPDPKIQEMADVVMESLTRAVDLMKPGVTSGEVDEACRGIIEKAGYYENFRKRTGYSFGLTWPEDMSLQKDDPTVLQPGMVFHLPVALRDYGKSMVGLSVAVAITEDGTEVLTEFPDGLFIK